MHQNYPTKKLGRVFFTTAGAQQPVNKATAEHQVNTWHGKMVPFLGLKSTCMANQYVLN